MDTAEKRRTAVGVPFPWTILVTPNAAKDVEWRHQVVGSYYLTPAAPGDHDLTADSITVGLPTLTSPALTQLHALTANGITAAVPIVGQGRFPAEGGGGGGQQKNLGMGLGMGL